MGVVGISGIVGGHVGKWNGDGGYGSALDEDVGPW